MGFKLRSASVSHVGHMRELNEDTYVANDRAGVWMVADGMGGHAGGDVASRLAVDSVCQQIADGANLSDAFLIAHERIVESAEQLDMKGMGTTLVAVRQKRWSFELAWVGDSRIYCFEFNGRADQPKLKQLSRDHSFVEDMVERGVLNRQEAAVHPQRHLIHQALGMPKSISVDRLQFKPRTRGVLLLCSDGVSDMLNDSQLAALLERYLKDKCALDELALELKNALLATPAKDNFTFVLVAYRPGWLNACLNRCRRL